MTSPDEPTAATRQDAAPSPKSAKLRRIVAGAVALLLVGSAGVFFAVHHVPSEGGAEEHIETEVPVHVARVVKTTLHRYVVGVGTVSPEAAHDDLPAAQAQLASPIAGVVVATHCAEGQHVEKGTTLFELDARTAVADEQKAVATQALAKSKLATAMSAYEFQQRELERTKRLSAESLASAKDVSLAEANTKAAGDEVAAAKAAIAEAAQSISVASARRSLLKIKAPLSGTVIRVFVNAGEAVDVTTPATVLAEIIDLERLVVSATVPAVEMPALKIGQPADLFVADRRDSASPSGAAPAGSSNLQATPAAPAAPAMKYEGRLSFIGFEVDRKTDSLPVRLSFSRELGLRPGQYLRIRIAVEERKDRLAVPAASVVVGADAGSVVYVVEGSRAVQRPVRVGLAEGGLVEVEGEGISVDTTVVTAGAYGLPADTKVRILGGP